MLRKKDTLRIGGCLSVAWMLIELSSTPARAQFAGGQTVASSEDLLSEVLVVAQRREERAQDVPISIEAFSGQQLVEVGVQNVQDLDLVTPGLNYGAVVGYAQPHLRGIGTTASGPAVENPVATYVDGVYYGAMAGGVLELANIDSIEIDKGPQGTLFGRNATGGLIQINTKSPTQAFEGSGSLTYGNYETAGATFYTSGGLTPQLAADISAFLRDQGKGYGVNFYNDEEVNKNRDLAVRSKWLWTPAVATTVTFTFDFEETHDAPALAPATIPLGGLPVPVPPQDLNGVFQPYGSIQQGGASASVKQVLDFAQLLSITAYRQGMFIQSFDGALTPYPALALNVYIKQPDRQFAQEFQLLSPQDQRISWVAGFFYYQADSREEPVQALGGLLSPLISTNTFPDQKSFSGALFGQATTEILPATDLTLGARYTVERKNFHTYGALDFVQGSPISETAPDVHQIYSKPTWRLGVDRKIDSDLMVFASYNRGFKSGGFNNELLPTTSYAAETLDAYEAGIKSEALEHTLRLNASVFFYNDKNKQAVRYPAGLLEIYNGAAAHIYGLDLDSQAKLTANFSLSGGMELLHTAYTSFPAADYTTLIPDGGGTNFATESAAGKQLSQAPKLTFDGSADYSVALPLARLGFNLTYAFNSGWFAEPDNRLRQPSYRLINAQVSVSSLDDFYEVRLWGRNLTDAQYAQSLASQANGDYVQYAPPRTYGITLERKL